MLGDFSSVYISQPKRQKPDYQSLCTYCALRLVSSSERATMINLFNIKFEFWFHPRDWQFGIFADKIKNFIISISFFCFSIDIVFDRKKQPKGDE